MILRERRPRFPGAPNRARQDADVEPGSSARAGRPALAFGLAALLSAASGGCASTIAPPRCPAEGGHPWWALTTKHFVALTDLDDAAARAKAIHLETTYEELRAAAFPRADSGPRTTVVVFREDAERLAFRPSFTAAEYMDQPGFDLERAPTLVLSAAAYPVYEAAARRVFLHEMTHALLRHTYGALPIWLNEGLASYLSSLRVDGHDGILGENVDHYRLTLEVMPSIGELLGTPRATFYGEGLAPLAAHDARYRYYASSWAFVHFLQNGPEAIRVRFGEMFRRLDAGATMRDAWRASLGQVPATDLERAFREYVTSTDLHAMARALAPEPPSPIEEVRRLDDTEVHLLWARLADDPGKARAQIAEAARAGGESAELDFERGCAALHDGFTSEADLAFRAALAREPNEPRYLFAALRTLRRQVGVAGVTASALGREWVTRLSKTARTSDELALAAELTSFTGDDAGAQRLIDAALAGDPGSFRALASRAQIHANAGRYGDAAADLTRAIALAPESVATTELTRRLREAQERISPPTP